MKGTVKKGVEAEASFGRPGKVLLNTIYDKEMQAPDGSTPCTDNSKFKGPFKKNPTNQRTARPDGAAL